MKNSKKKIESSNVKLQKNQKNDLKKRFNTELQTNYFNLKIIFFSILIYIVFYFLYNFFTSIDDLKPFEQNEFIFSKDKDEKKWGSFRSGHYFGLKTLAIKSMVFGFMWFNNEIQHNYVPIRHWCENGDNIKSYGWLKHDFDSFGIQKIIDNKFNITTSFIIGNNSNWTAQINVNLLDEIKEKNANLEFKNIFSFVPYFALDSLNDQQEEIYFDQENSTKYKTFIKGRTAVFKNGFTAKIELKYKNTFIYSANLNKSSNPPLLKIKDKLIENLFVTSFPGKEHDRTKYLIVLKNKNIINNEMSEVLKPNIVLQQIAVTVPAKIEISFNGNNSLDELNFNYKQELKERIKTYDLNFEEKFLLKKRNFTEKEIEFGKYILSNMIGSIGSFYGYSRVVLNNIKKKDSTSKEDFFKYGPFNLLTSVPSRSFFPRGFLWDEGFHQLLISKYNLNLSKTIIKSWFNLINKKGWIPREVILGVEAEAKVPNEFINQNTENVNPPTFFITLDSILNLLTINQKDVNKKKEIEEFKNYFKNLFPKLKIWYNYLNKTQKGYKFGTYRWRGRDPNIITELNVKTLTSGLDDYPRASSPTEKEIHLDLFSWMVFSTKIMYKLANFLDDQSKVEFKIYYDLLIKNNDILDNIYWSKKNEMYCDFGLNSKNVSLVEFSSHQPLIRKELEDPKYECINEFGYVSLFPFLLQLIQPENHRLNIILDRLINKNLLWSEYGLRSLATNSNYYKKYNTRNDPPYWRGAIWININYLALRSLNYYSITKGPYQKKCKDIYKKLKHNLFSNVFKQYERTGYVWESYDDNTGLGRGTYPFTGWSSLTLLIMSDNYD